jgi:hypothetical protein
MRLYNLTEMKRLLISTLLISIFNISNGQESKFVIGIELVPTAVTLHSNDFLKDIQDPRLSFFGGVDAEYRVSKNISVKTGIGFERKGNQLII